MPRILSIVAVVLALVAAFAFALQPPGAAGAEGHPAHAAYTMADLAAEQRRSGGDYHGFLRVPSMSAGLYVLPAGAIDKQQPHQRDEIYYVVEGSARFEVDGEDMPVAAGAVLYVQAGVAHRFHRIDEDLKVLVVFAGE